MQKVGLVESRTEMIPKYTLLLFNFERVSKVGLVQSQTEIIRKNKTFFSTSDMHFALYVSLNWSGPTFDSHSNESKRMKTGLCWFSAASTEHRSCRRYDCNWGPVEPYVLHHS